MNELMIVTVENVRGYLDGDVVKLNLEDCARGLGFTTLLKQDFYATSGIKKYENEVVRWSRVTKYLEEISETILWCRENDAETFTEQMQKDYDELVKSEYKPEFVSESVFYMLVNKSKSAPAKKFQLHIAYKVCPAIRKQGYYSAFTDEQLMQHLIEKAGDLEKLRSVIAPGLQQSDALPLNVVQFFLGLTDEQIGNNPKLLKWAKSAGRAKELIRYWEYRGLGDYTVKDLPESRIPEFILRSLIKQLKVKERNREFFADYCGETHFDRRGYDLIVDQLVRRGTLTLEEGEEWKKYRNRK